MSKVGAGSDFKLDIKLIQGYTLIKASAGNSYGFSSSLLRWQRNTINVLLLTQAAGFQKISHRWPFTLCLALFLSKSTWSESNAALVYDGIPAGCSIAVTTTQRSVRQTYFSHFVTIILRGWEVRMKGERKKIVFSSLVVICNCRRKQRCNSTFLTKDWRPNYKT